MTIRRRTCGISLTASAAAKSRTAHLNWDSTQPSPAKWRLRRCARGAPFNGIRTRWTSFKNRWHKPRVLMWDCKPDVAVSLKGVAISGFRMVRVPRDWDDRQRREAQVSANVGIGRLAGTFKGTLGDWTLSVLDLASRIRY